MDINFKFDIESDVLEIFFDETQPEKFAVEQDLPWIEWGYTGDYCLRKMKISECTKRLNGPLLMELSGLREGSYDFDCVYYDDSDSGTIYFERGGAATTLGDEITPYIVDVTKEERLHSIELLRVKRWAPFLQKAARPHQRPRR